MQSEQNTYTLPNLYSLVSLIAIVTPDKKKLNPSRDGGGKPRISRVERDSRVALGGQSGFYFY